MNKDTNMKNTLADSWQGILLQVKSLQESCAFIEGSRIALFGAGAAGKEAWRYLKNKNIGVQCFIDNNIQKQGTEVEGIPVVSASHSLATSASFVLITAKTAVNIIRRQLQGLHFQCMPFDAYYVFDNLERYARIRNEVFRDDVSRFTLDGILMAMLTGSLKYCPEIMTSNQYFCLPHFQDIGEEYFVDAGAYVGETAEKFIWANAGLFHHIYMFEPGIQQFAALQSRISRLITEWAIDPAKISAINAGLSDRNSSAHFGTTSTKLAATAIDNGAGDNRDIKSCVPLWRLDSYLEQHPSPVTFIKADVEGMELPMLNGAANTICRYKPKLALSVYHRPEDLIDIIGFVENHVPEYRMSLRHHSSNLSETVLYCWVDKE